MNSGVFLLLRYWCLYNYHDQVSSNEQFCTLKFKNLVKRFAELFSLKDEKETEDEVRNIERGTDRQNNRHSCSTDETDEGPSAKYDTRTYRCTKEKRVH